MRGYGTPQVRVKLAPEGRAFLTALLAPLPRQVLHRLRLVIRPDTVLRWHRDLIKRRNAHTCRPKRPGRPPTVRSIRALNLHLVRENPAWGYRRVHGELATLGTQVAASAVWEIPTSEGVAPAPDRAAPNLCRLPALASRRSPGLRLHRDRHPDRPAPVHPRGHRTRHPPRQDPRHHCTPHRRLGQPSERGRPPGRAHRHTNPAHERPHGALGPNLPPRTAGPHPHRERTPVHDEYGALAESLACLEREPGAEVVDDSVSCGL